MNATQLELSRCEPTATRYAHLALEKLISEAGPLEVPRRLESRNGDTRRRNSRRRHAGSAERNAVPAGRSMATALTRRTSPIARVGTDGATDGA